MAKATKSPGNGDGPPDPIDDDQNNFWAWLNTHRGAITVLGSRAALRVVPLVQDAKQTRENGTPYLPAPSYIALPVFCANAMARLFALYGHLRNRDGFDHNVDPHITEARKWAGRASGADDYGGMQDNPAAGAADYAAAAACAAIGIHDPWLHGPQFLCTMNAINVAAAAATRPGDDPEGAAIYAAYRHDAQQLLDGVLPEKLASSSLWPDGPPPRIGGAWREMMPALRALGDHWSVWIDWYEDVLHGVPHTEGHEAAFTNLSGVMIWSLPSYVNEEIKDKLRRLGEGVVMKPPPSQL